MRNIYNTKCFFFLLLVIPIVLVGLKKDLRSDIFTVHKLRQIAEQPVKEEDGHAMAEKIGAYAYVECSAKCNEGITEVLETVTHALFNITPLLFSTDEPLPQPVEQHMMSPHILTNEESTVQDTEHQPHHSLPRNEESAAQEEDNNPPSYLPTTRNKDGVPHTLL